MLLVAAVQLRHPCRLNRATCYAERVRRGSESVPALADEQSEAMKFKTLTCSLACSGMHLNPNTLKLIPHALRPQTYTKSLKCS